MGRNQETNGCPERLKAYTSCRILVLHSKQPIALPQAAKVRKELKERKWETLQAHSFGEGGWLQKVLNRCDLCVRLRLNGVFSVEPFLERGDDFALRPERSPVVLGLAFPFSSG